MKFSRYVFFSCLLILLISISTFAGETEYYIEERIITAAPNEPSDTTFCKMWFADKKFRREQGILGDITIGRLDQGLFWMISLRDSTYSEMNLTMVQQIALLTLAMMGAQMNEKGEIMVPDDLYLHTGNKKKVGAWNTEEIALNPKYAGQGFMESFSLWVTKDLNLPAKLFADNMNRILGEPKGPAEKLLKLWSTLEGYPVMMETNMMGFTTTTITTKIEKISLSDDLFQLPPGLKQVPNPFMEGFERMMNR